eukprot:15436344-Alexandrium_andersonii.AAC.1
MCPGCLSTVSASEAFIKTVQNLVSPGTGRALLVEKMDYAYDWTSWFGNLGITMSGLVPSSKEHSVNHDWRFVRRSDVPEYDMRDNAMWEVEVQNKDHALHTHT